MKTRTPPFPLLVSVLFLLLLLTKTVSCFTGDRPDISADMAGEAMLMVIMSMRMVMTMMMMVMSTIAIVRKLPFVDNYD